MTLETASALAAMRPKYPWPTVLGVGEARSHAPTVFFGAGDAAGSGGGRGDGQGGAQPRGLAPRRNLEGEGGRDPGRARAGRGVRTAPTARARDPRARWPAREHGPPGRGGGVPRLPRNLALAHRLH